MLNQLIANLKKYTKTWKEFNTSNENNYTEFFKDTDKFLKSKSINIVHSYDNDTLRIEYIVYYRGEVIDMNNELNIFANPYWVILEDCFNFLENGNNNSK